MKKGQGQVVAWVLLIGLTVSLAVIVTTWTRQQAEETTSGIVGQAEIDLRCASVSFNALPDCEGETMDIMNRGDFTIHKLVFHMNNADGLKSSTWPTGNLLGDEEYRVIPGERKNINTGLGSMKQSTIDITPFIKIEENYVGCTARKLTVKCEI